MLKRFLTNYLVRGCICALTVILSSGDATAQDFQSIPFTDSRWQINGDGSALETYRGRSSMKLGNDNGNAQLSDIVFSNGIIEIDFAISELVGFPGIQFRIQDELKFEDVNFRAHMNAKEDALAYAPTYGGNSTWQLFHGPGFWGISNSRSANGPMCALLFREIRVSCI